MGFNDHIDFELLERIEELRELGHLQEGTPEYGIALKVANEGEAPLSPAQFAVWKRVSETILRIPLDDGEAFQRALEADWRAENG